MMDESSTLLHRRKEKSVCCVCVRARQRGGWISRYEAARGERIGIVILVRYVLKRIRRGPERVVAEEYVALIRREIRREVRRETDRE